MAYRTDLAVELLENLRGRDELSGVSEREYEREGLHIHEAEVTTERGCSESPADAILPCRSRRFRGARRRRFRAACACSPHSSKR